MDKNLSLKQLEQEEQYSVPYHYIPLLQKGNFSQSLSWSWGMHYLAGIELVLSVLKRESFSSVLDVGCGDGRFLREASNAFEGVKFHGIDYSEKAIAFARAFNPSLSYSCFDIETESLDKKYDVVTMMEVLEHIPPGNVPTFLESVSQALSPGGRLFLTVPHINKMVNDKHYQHFSNETLRNALEPHFRVQQIMPFDRQSRVIGRLTRLLGYSGGNYIITNRWINTVLFRRVLKGCLNEQSESKASRLLAIAEPRG